MRVYGLPRWSRAGVEVNLNQAAEQLWLLHLRHASKERARSNLGRVIVLLPLTLQSAPSPVKRPPLHGRRQGASHPLTARPGPPGGLLLGIQGKAAIVSSGRRERADRLFF